MRFMPKTAAFALFFAAVQAHAAFPSLCALPLLLSAAPTQAELSKASDVIREKFAALIRNPDFPLELVNAMAASATVFDVSAPLSRLYPEAMRRVREIRDYARVLSAKSAELGDALMRGLRAELDVVAAAGRGGAETASEAARETRVARVTAVSVGHDGTEYEWERVQDAKHGSGWWEPDVGQRRRLIWWDRVEHGKNWEQAKEFCKSLGLYLPKRADFKRLRDFMGSEPGTHEGFEPQVLPDLGRRFWSSSVHPTHSGLRLRIRWLLRPHLLLRS